MSTVLEETESSRSALDPIVDPPGVARSAQAVDAPSKKARRGRLLLMVVVLVGIGALAVGIRSFLASRDLESTDDAFIEGRVIPISPQISARVLAVHFDDNQLVHRGDLLIELDPVDYQAGLEQVRGARAAASGKLEQAKTQIAAAQASQAEAQAALDVADVNLENATLDLKRYEGLDERARTRQQYDNAVAAEKTARAQVEQAKAKRSSAQAEIATARANVTAAAGDLAKADADVHRAEVNLGYTRITAPEDGRITRKNIEPGAYTMAGQAMFALVPRDVWVVANFKETQLGRMRPGQPVNIVVDAYPKKRFTGKVDSIQSGTGSRFSMLPAENATGNYVKVVQRVPVKIDLDPEQTKDPQHLLAPGMSAEPSVKVR